MAFSKLMSLLPGEHHCQCLPKSLQNNIAVEKVKQFSHIITLWLGEYYDLG